MKQLKALATLAALAASPVLAQTPGVTDTEIKIGGAHDLSGIFAPVSAAQAYFEEVNANGGVHGRKITYIVEDHGYQVPKAAQAANKLINRDQVFAMLLNLVSASNAENKDVLWAFISRYAPGVTASTHPELDALVGYAIRYFDDFVKPTKSFKVPDDVERTALEKLDETLAALPADADGSAIQDAVLDVARSIERYQDPSKKGPDGGPGVSVVWFSALYQLLLGQEKGPRFGSFVALYGIAETREMIRKALAGELTA